MKLGQSDVRTAIIVRSEQYVVRDGITIIMYKMARAIDVGVHRNSTASSASGLVDICKVSTMKIRFPLLRKVAAECDRNVPDMERPLAFVKFRYLMGNCNPMILNAGSIKAIDHRASRI